MSNGYAKGEVCNRNGCAGVIEEAEKDGCCSCHINPPCSYCTTNSAFCANCGWDSAEENKNTASFCKSVFEKAFYEQECYDKLKESFCRKWRGEEPAATLTIRQMSHTHFSMIVQGVFPKNTETRSSIYQKVTGTFGGRFVFFEDFRFEFIAYTD